MWRLTRLRRLPPWARHYLREAIVYLIAARIALRVFPFRSLTWFCEWKDSKPELRGAERARRRKGVRWGIQEAARFLPGQSACFARALAAQALLRRYGVSTTLYYGAASRSEQGLMAHVWLLDGSEGIVGHEAAQDYHILASFPEAR